MIKTLSDYLNEPVVLDKDYWKDCRSKLPIDGYSYFVSKWSEMRYRVDVMYRMKPTRMFCYFPYRTQARNEAMKIAMFHNEMRKDR